MLCRARKKEERKFLPTHLPTYLPISPPRPAPTRPDSSSSNKRKKNPAGNARLPALTLPQPQHLSVSIRSSSNRNPRQKSKTKQEAAATHNPGTGQLYRPVQSVAPPTWFPSRARYALANLHACLCPPALSSPLLFCHSLWWRCAGPPGRFCVLDTACDGLDSLTSPLLCARHPPRPAALRCHHHTLRRTSISRQGVAALFRAASLMPRSADPLWSTRLSLPNSPPPHPLPYPTRNRASYIHPQLASPRLHCTSLFLNSRILNLDLFSDLCLHLGVW